MVSHRHPAAVGSMPSKPPYHHTSHHIVHYTKPGESCPKILRKALPRQLEIVADNPDMALAYPWIAGVVVVMGIALAFVLVVAGVRVACSSCRCVSRLP